MRHRSCFFLLGLSAASLGCSNDGSGASEPGAPEHARYCAALCDRQAACAGAAQPGCRTLCEHDPGARGRSGQIWALQADCIAARSCSEWDSSAARAGCLELALEILPASESCVAFCADGAARAFECGGGHSIADCVQGQACAYRDDVLDDANVCNAELDCDARASCMAGAFGTL